MTRDKGRGDGGHLRRRAEQRLRARKEAANQALRDPEHIVHELEIHQVELEIQAEELRDARVELEAALARYTEIFDFAPIGHVALTSDGVIRELNHAGAKLVERSRSQLVGQSFSRLVAPRYSAVFAELMRPSQSKEPRTWCELELLGRPGETVAVRVTSTPLSHTDQPSILLSMLELEPGRADRSSGCSPATGWGRETGMS